MQAASGFGQFAKTSSFHVFAPEFTHEMSDEVLSVQQDDAKL